MNAEEEINKRAKGMSREDIGNTIGKCAEIYDISYCSLQNHSGLSNSYVKHPLDVVKLGDIVDVKVLSVDINRKRIQLSMKNL